MTAHAAMPRACQLPCFFRASGNGRHPDGAAVQAGSLRNSSSGALPRQMPGKPGVTAFDGEVLSILEAASDDDPSLSFQLVVCRGGAGKYRWSLAPSTNFSFENLTWIFGRKYVGNYAFEN